MCEKETDSERKRRGRRIEKEKEKREGERRIEKGEEERSRKRESANRQTERKEHIISIRFSKFHITYIIVYTPSPLVMPSGPHGKCWLSGRIKFCTQDP